MYTVAVSYLEWIRWVATGWFRCSDRVVWVEGGDDQFGFDAMFDRTPDLQVSDDQGFVIARLRSDSLISDRVGWRERSVGHLWLSVAAVSSFHPLSIRGARLLEADAERAAVRLEEPQFENAWTDWRDRRLEDEAHSRGLSMCAAFGLDSPVVKDIPHQVSDILAGRKAAPNAAKAREDAIEGTRALGWASAMSVAVMDSDVRAAFKGTPEFGQIQSLIKVRKDNFDLGRPLLDDKPMIEFVRSANQVIQKLGAQVLPLELMAIVLHYKNLAAGGRPLSLNALVEDLVAITLEDPRYASLGAYFIGRSMENVAVTTLLYQSDPARYPALAPSADRIQLNIMSLAAEKLEERQSTEEDKTFDLRGASYVTSAEENLAAASHSGGNLAVEQAAVGQDMAGRSAPSPGDSSTVLVAAASPGDSNSERLTTASPVGEAEPQGTPKPTSDQQSGEETNTPKNLSAEPLGELFPQLSEDPKQVSTSKKKKKKGKEL